MDTVIDTPRLVLRRFYESNVAALYELGYRFVPEFRGMGLATEAGQASIDFARSTLGLTRLVALVHPDNTASARAVEKLGFRVEKQVRYSGLDNIDVNLFARLV